MHTSDSSHSLAPQDTVCYTFLQYIVMQGSEREAFVETRATQLLKGTLDMCLLATIAQRPCYGYEMVQRLAQQGLALVSEGSIYPLLSRLQQRGYLEGYLVPSTDGPPRKYYRLTPTGAEQLAAWQAEWDRFAQAVAQILKGARSDVDPRSADPRPGLRPQ
jgi:PadR family transcriptional regulator, regulatory protein PadR